MIQKYDTTQQKRVDVSQIRRHDGSKWVDVQFVRRYDGSKWVDVWVNEYEFYQVLIEDGTVYTPNGSSATVIPPIDDFSRIGFYYNSSNGEISNAHIKGTCISNKHSSGELIAHLNTYGKEGDTSTYLYNGQTVEATYIGTLTRLELVLFSKDSEQTTFTLSNFTINDKPVVFV